MTELPPAPDCASAPARHHWLRALETALARNEADAHSRYFQLASVDADGQPRNRTLVFRGFADIEGTLLAVTDTRSAKHMQLARCAAVELCWYFSATREQFRISGEVYLHSADQGDAALRARCWQSLSEPARAQFFQAAPGLPLVADAVAAETPAATLPALSDTAPPTFCVLAVQPRSVDYLNLLATNASGTPCHARWLSEYRDGDWQVLALNP